MKITGIEVDGFGVWSELRIEELTDKLHVFYGANEAGKTTLMQFVRNVLYGFSPSRRARYLPPLRGGRPGGTLHVSAHNGRFRVSRHLDLNTRSELGDVSIFSDDGTRHGDHILGSLTNGVDESIFENLFAIGLREIQELGSLTDVRAAELLYKLSTGVDRVSLVDVMRELATSRGRILSHDEKPSQITALLEDRERIQTEINELRLEGRNYYNLATERERLNDDIAEAETLRKALADDARTVEAALAVFDRWQDRGTVDTELELLGDVPDVPEAPRVFLARVDKRIKSRRQALRELVAQHNKLGDESDTLPLKESLWREKPRIEALAEQQTWLESLTAQVAKLEGDTSALEKHAHTEHDKLGIAGPRISTGTISAPPNMNNLRAAAKQWGAARARLREAKEKLEQLEKTQAESAAEMKTALAGRSEKALAEAIEKAGAQVAQVRRRVQVEQKLDQLARQQEELSSDVHDSLEDQILPGPTLAVIGAFFLLGFVLIASSMFMPASVVGTGQSAGIVFLLGFVSCGFSAILYFNAQREASDQLDSSRRQFDVLGNQVEKVKAEAEELDRKLPRGSGGPWTVRLQTAEKELQDLEQLLGMDGRRGSTDGEVTVARGLVEKAAAEERVGRKRWQQAVHDAGLPEDATPNDLKRYQGGWRRLTDANSTLNSRRQELTQMKRDLAALELRIKQTASDADIVTKSDRPIDQLREMVEHLRAQHGHAERRDEIRKEMRLLSRRKKALERELRVLRKREYDYLSRLGVKSAAELDHVLEKAKRRDELRQRRQALDREIATAIAGRAELDAVERLLTARITASELSDEKRRLANETHATDERLRDRSEKRGRLAEQMRKLSDDRRLTNRVLDLGVIEERLSQAIERWQVLAVCGRMMENIRRQYEVERQPETLRDASDHMKRLTEGSYVRVWTPIDEDVLKVDDAAGRTLSVEVLSRGTREQLFLSLRLALASALARRGANMPMVLDDILVNFDARRARAALVVLRDFAAAGHQVLLFTCHEHMLRLTRSLKIPIHRLPANSEAAVLRLSQTQSFDADPIVEEPLPAPPPPPPPPPPKPARKPPEPKPPKVEVKPKKPEPELVQLIVPPPKPATNGAHVDELGEYGLGPLVRRAAAELPFRAEEEPPPEPEIEIAPLAPKFVPRFVVEPPVVITTPSLVVEPTRIVMPAPVELPKPVEPPPVVEVIEATITTDTNGRVKLRPRFWAPFEGSQWQEQVADDEVDAELVGAHSSRLDREHYWFGQARGPLCEQTHSLDLRGEELEEEIALRQTAFSGLARPKKSGKARRAKST